LEALEQLHYIEHCKRKGMSLEEIKGSLHHENPRSLIEYSLNYENNDLVQKIDELNNHLKDIMQLIKKLDEKDNQVIKSHLTPESLTAMHSLLTVFS
ncbi:MerR family DNA-binding protein, partial [Priestia megaterium]